MKEQSRVFRSKKKLTGTRAMYRPWREWEVGDIIVGKYVGSQTDNYDKPNWLVEVASAQFVNKKDNKKFEGHVIGLNSNGKLDKAMQKVSEGEYIQVEYKGMSEIDKGKYKGKEAHDVEVELVEEDGGEDVEDTDDL